MDPQSRPGEFSSSAGSCGVTRWGSPFAVHACRAAVSSVRRVHFFRAERHDRFPRRSEETGEGSPAAASLPSVGSYSPRIAGCRETEDRPARRRPSPLRARLDLRILLSGQWPLTASAQWVGCAAVPEGQWRIGRASTRPVLKHGPRSLACARVIGCYET